MPCARLLDSCLLLTHDGWLPCRGKRSKVRVAGIDRYGKVTLESAAVCPLPSIARPVFLGTSKCCGLLSPTTIVQSSVGKFKAAEIVEAGSIGVHKFESLLYLDSMQFGPRQAEHLWQALGTETASIDNLRAIIRCRGGFDGPEFGVGFGDLWKRDGRRFYSLRRDRLEHNASRIPLLLNELTQVFTNDDKLAELSRAGAALAMAIGSALAMRGKAYELSYDTLQHTAAVYVDTDAGTLAGIAAGKCAHFLEQQCIEVELSWSSAHWNPLCNGLVIVGG